MGFGNSKCREKEASEVFGVEGYKPAGGVIKIPDQKQTFASAHGTEVEL